MKPIPETFKNGIPIGPTQQADIKQLREAGCDCDIPLLGYKSARSTGRLLPCCRLCNIVANPAR